MASTTAGRTSARPGFWYGFALTASLCVGVGQASGAPAAGKDVLIPGDRTFPESITSTADGTSSLAAWPRAKS
jgi:hypothetical protein